MAGPGQPAGGAPRQSHAGQPTKANPVLARRIAAKIASGIRMADAAESCGVDRSSLFNWMAWAKAGNPEFTAFASIINAAVSAGKKPRQAG